MRSNISIKTTGDGSNTLFNPDLNEHYHSIHGALTESRHVFIKHGLMRVLENKTKLVSVLEVGLGTGLNAALTADIARTHATQIQYTALEPFLVEKKILECLNFDSILSESEFSAWEKIHLVAWERPEIISTHFVLTKLNVSISDFMSGDVFDLIFFDAFAPEKQPEMWTVEIFKHCFNWLKPGGLLVSYCAKGQFKRKLKQVGFVVNSAQGPPGKREMTIALKPIS